MNVRELYEIVNREMFRGNGEQLVLMVDHNANEYEIVEVLDNDEVLGIGIQKYVRNENNG